MEKFVGTWKLKPGTMQNDEAAMEAAKMTAEEKAKYKDKSFVIKYELAGDKVKQHVDMDGKVKDYTYPLNETVELEGLDDVTYQALSELVGDKLKESYTRKDGKPGSVTLKEIVGSDMKVTVTVGETTMSYEMMKA